MNMEVVKIAWSVKFCRAVFFISQEVHTIPLIFNLVLIFPDYDNSRNEEERSHKDETDTENFFCTGYSQHCGCF